MPLRRASSLVGLEVRFRDIRLGVAVEVFLDPDARRAFGVEVRCGDGRNRFLPLSSCEEAEGALSVPSALVLMETAYYRERGRPLGALRGRHVTRGDETAGALVDLVVDEEGTAHAVVVEDGGRTAELPFAPDVALVPEELRPAV